jgi:hypothetical protein
LIANLICLQKEEADNLHSQDSHRRKYQDNSQDQLLDQSINVNTEEQWGAHCSSPDAILPWKSVRKR